MLARRGRSPRAHTTASRPKATWSARSSGNAIVLPTCSSSARTVLRDHERGGHCRGTRASVASFAKHYVNRGPEAHQVPHPRSRAIPNHRRPSTTRVTVQRLLRNWGHQRAGIRRDRSRERRPHWRWRSVHGRRLIRARRGRHRMKASSPWSFRLQAIQLPRFDFDRWVAGARASPAPTSGRPLLGRPDPAKLSRRSKLFQLTW